MRRPPATGGGTRVRSPLSAAAGASRAETASAAHRRADLVRAVKPARRILYLLREMGRPLQPERPAPPVVDARPGIAALNAVAELGPDILSVIDADGTLVYNSPVAERIHG